MRYALLLVLILSAPAVGVAGMVEVGAPAPELRVLDLAGQPQVLGAAAPDRAVLVMFCSVGCVPCKESEPLLAEAQRLLGRQLTAAVVMLAAPAQVREMLRVGGAEPDLRFVADAAGEGLFPVASAYGVLGTPTTFLIGRDGRVLWRYVGALRSDHLERDLPRALARDGVGVAVQP